MEGRQLNVTLTEDDWLLLQELVDRTDRGEDARLEGNVDHRPAARLVAAGFATAHSLNLGATLYRPTAKGRDALARRTRPCVPMRPSITG